MEAEGAARRLAAILFADIVGYGALMAEDEERGLRVRERIVDVVRALVAEHGGSLAEVGVDETVSTFPTALGAVSCAVAIQERLRGDSILVVRVGVHHGDLGTPESEKDATYLAAAIALTAAPGGIRVSAAAFGELRGRLKIGFTDLGPVPLARFPEPVHLYAIHVGGEREKPAPIATPQRRLAAILEADVVSYSRLMATQEDSTVRTVTRYRSVFVDHVRQHGGRIIDTSGDGVLAEFGSALQAVRCAVAVQENLRERNAALPAASAVRFRIGIDVGDVRVEGDRIYGSGVNVAARLEALAPPGGLCISAPVHEQVRYHLDRSFEDLGERKLTNIPHPVHAYALALDGTGPPSRRVSARRRAVIAAALGALLLAALGWWAFRNPVTASANPIRSLAVLPLENLSGDPAQEYFADGMTEELIGELAKLGALRVISRTSVMQYKRERKPLPKIAQELNVDGIIEGTVTRADDRVRITAQLIDARNDQHLWSERYDRALTDVLALQSEIARAVAEQVRVELTPEEQAALAVSRSVDRRAYDAYLRGLEARGSGVSFVVTLWAPAAIEHFERAVEIDPGFAEAWAALAFAREWLAANPFDARDRALYAKARDAAQRALDLDDSLGAAHAALGGVLFNQAWDFEAGRAATERAVKVSPSDPIALNAYAWYLIVVAGRTDEALGVMESLQRVAPFDRFFRGIRVRNFTWAHQYGRALEELERVRELDPGFADLEVMVSYFHLDRLEEAHRAHVAMYQRCGPTCDWMREAIERGWSKGRWNGSIHALAEAASRREGYSPLLVAYWYSLIEDAEEAFVWLERGYRERDPLMVHLKHPAAFDPLRSDPRYADLIRRIGLPGS
jgi:class 3 adenylate cyclase/TolB-like protein/tetratricopeptide (TPR) repeat protein